VETASSAKSASSQRHIRAVSPLKEERTALWKSWQLHIHDFAIAVVARSNLEEAGTSNLEDTLIDQL
jgi:hypothetical protein